MFRDLVKKASNMTAAAMENLQTPEKDGGTDGGKAGNKGNPTSTPSSGIKNASREDLIDLLRRTRAQNKQIKQKYIELSKKEKYFERRSESLTTFLTDTVGIKIEEDDILVFPSKSLHGTQPNKLNSGRISISGDIVCVAKDSELLENMMPPINNWDKL